MISALEQLAAAQAARIARADPIALTTGELGLAIEDDALGMVVETEGMGWIAIAEYARVLTECTVGSDRAPPKCERSKPRRPSA